MASKDASIVLRALCHGIGSAERLMNSFRCGRCDIAASSDALRAWQVVLGGSLLLTGFAGGLVYFKINNRAVNHSFNKCIWAP